MIKCNHSTINSACLIAFTKVEYCYEVKFVTCHWLFFAVPCAPGAFFNTSGPAATCDPCPLHHYQNKSEQTECKACPTGTFTIARGSSELGDCRGIVQSVKNRVGDRPDYKKD